MDQIYLLEFTTVSEDSDILSHKQCIIIEKLNEISKILMVRAHIDEVKYPAFHFHFHLERSRNPQDF